MTIKALFNEHPKLSFTYAWFITKKFSSKLLSFGLIAFGLHGMYAEMYQLFYFYPQYYRFLSKIHITSQSYDQLIRNSVYLVVANVFIATLGLTILAVRLKHIRIIRLILGSGILIFAYAASNNFNLPKTPQTYLQVLLDGLLFSR